MRKYEHGGTIYDKEVFLDFSANVNPFGMPEGVKQAILEGMEYYHQYPDEEAMVLRRAIAEEEKIERNDVICGNGASDLIYRLCYSLRPKKAYVLAPTFSEYEKALHAVSCEVKYLELKEESRFCFRLSLMEQLEEDTDLLFLCNPNNPVGNVLEPETLQKVLEECIRKNIFLVLDECFLDFLPEHEKYSGKKFLRQPSACQNLFVLKAFTKLYGMAGIRLGYGLCKNRQLLSDMKFHGPSWSVSGPAQAAGIAALKEQKFVSKTRVVIEEEREYLKQQLTVLGFEVFDSKVNYLLFRADDKLYEDCLRQKILIRNCENYIGLSNEYYRVAVRLRKESDLLLACLKNRRSGGEAVIWQK